MRCQSDSHTKTTHKGDCVGSVSIGHKILMIGHKILMAVTRAAWDGWSDNPSDTNWNPNLF